MQQNVYEMIPDDRIAPELMFEPERAVEQRIILLSCRPVNPYTPESLEGLQFWWSHMR
jgi:hypothetical protein